MEHTLPANFFSTEPAPHPPVVLSAPDGEQVAEYIPEPFRRLYSLLLEHECSLHLEVDVRYWPGARPLNCPFENLLPAEVLEELHAVAITTTTNAENGLMVSSVGRTSREEDETILCLHLYRKGKFGFLQTSVHCKRWSTSVYNQNDLSDSFLSLY